jgi:nucleoside-diphosphate-sugar epimerase
MVQGDLMNVASLRKAIDGCDAVIHCAYGTGGLGSHVRRVTGKGTANMVRAAEEAGVKRFVHVSSTVVYGRVKGLVVHEGMPYMRTGDAYTDGKVDAEKAVLHSYHSRGLPAVIFRPAIVYGPYSQTWTVGPLQALRRGETLLVGRGNTYANTIYVDNLVDAILLALECQAAVGECFNITDDDRITWKDFYGAYAQMLGLTEVPNVSVEEYRAMSRGHGGLLSLKEVPREMIAVLASQEFKGLALKGLQYPGLRSLARLLIRTLPSGVTERGVGWYRDLVAFPSLPSPSTAPWTQLDRNSLYLHTANVRYDVDKARMLLGFSPAIGFREGMGLTRCWAKFTRLIPQG